ncbi:MAG: SpoIID/LytB domain-containing protein [Acidimicrobiales bacterium]
MRDGRRGRLMLAGCMLAGLATAAAPAATATAKERKPPAPPRGWVVDRVRFENLAPDGFVQAAGTGDVRGVLDVVPGGGGVAVVNELSLDDYLRGVAEVPSTWPVEALRAQAIAARTFVLHEMRKDAASAARGVGADVCATQACQVYIGMAKERADGGDRWVQAVQATSGQVLLYKDEPILAQYSSSNGGRSVAGGRPYLKGAVNDPDSARGPYGHWKVSLGYGQLTSVFGLPAPLASLRRTGDVVVLDWAAPSGTKGQTEVPVQAFRDRLNEAVPPQGDLPRAVPSTQFSVLADDQGGTATLDGSGHGHGIGMSQFGALGKATRGLRAADILASYYGGLRPVALPPERLPPAVRVALDLGGGAVSIGGTGRFRVIDGSGAPLAVAAQGTWRVTTAGRGKVRVVPPTDQDAPPSVAEVTASGPDVVGPAGEARFALGSAAVVQVRVEGAALSAPSDTARVLVNLGSSVVPLPPLPVPVRYTVTVAADAGAGRVTRLSVPLRVRSAVPAAVRGTLAGAGPASGLPRPAAVAFGLLVAVVVALWRAFEGAGHTVAAWPRRGSSVLS